MIDLARFFVQNVRLLFSSNRFHTQSSKVLSRETSRNITDVYLLSKRIEGRSFHVHCFRSQARIIREMCPPRDFGNTLPTAQYTLACANFPNLVFRRPARAGEVRDRIFNRPGPNRATNRRNSKTKKT